MTDFIDELRDLVGQTRRYTAPEAIGAASARYYAMALGMDHDPHPSASFDASDAGLVPPTLIFDSNQLTGLSADVNGFAGHQWDVSPGWALIRAGHRYEWFRDVRIDDVVSTEWTLTDVQSRRSKNGRPMVTVTNEARYVDAGGDVIATQQETTLLLGPIGE